MNRDSDTCGSITERSSIHIKGKEKHSRAERVFEAIMAKSLSNLTNYTNLQIHSLFKGTLNRYTQRNAWQDPS